MAASALNLWAATNQARRRYEAAGYAVAASERLEPNGGPELEAELMAYFVARKGEGDSAETRIIEFAPANGNEGSDARLAALQTLVDSRPGWHLDIVEIERPTDAQPPAQDVIADWIAEAWHLLPISAGGAVALARRAVSGALFRLEVARGERYREPPDLSSSLIGGLETDGAISIAEAETLRSFHAASSTSDISRDDGLALEELTEASLRIAERCSAEDADVVAEMLAWFERHFCTPEQAGIAADSATGGYVWLGAGPFNARAVLRTRFGESEPASLDRAVFLLEQDGLTWARRDSDQPLPTALASDGDVMPTAPDTTAGAAGLGGMIGASPGRDGLGLVERHHILQWAGTLPARAELVELVRDLILETTPAHDLVRIDCPTAEGIGRPDFDLVVESHRGTVWVPEGRSCWELSTSADVEQNADTNYRKRTAEERSEADEVSYIHLTPRLWPEVRTRSSKTSRSADPNSADANRKQAKRRWQQGRSDEGHWRDVRALDVDDLSNWLNQAPATRARLSESHGLIPDGFASASRRWEQELARTGGRLSAEVLLAGRELQCQGLVESCSTGGGTTYVVAESSQEALEFILATGASDGALLNRMLLVSDVAAWRRLKREPGGGAILVATEFAVADGSERSEHHTIVPLVQAMRPSTGSAKHEALIEVERVDPTVAADALERQGIDRNEAWRLAALARRSLGALRRTLQLGPRPVMPAWLDRLPEDRGRAAVWAALLAGRWSEQRMSDRLLLCELDGSGRSYEELLLVLRPLSEGADPLIAQVGDQWELVAPSEAWRLLSAKLPEDTFNRFSAQAKRVLTETETIKAPDGTDFEINGVKLARTVYSDELRHGIARTVALLGTLGFDAGRVSGMSAATRSALIVRDLLVSDDADDERGPRGELAHSGPASDSTENAVVHTLGRIVELANVLHLLAEAAPDEFLDAALSALYGAQGNPDCLRALSEASAGPSADAGWHGLRRSLETLAWSPESGHLPLVSDALLAIAALGSDDLASNAHDCLVSLFRPWLPQTGLSTDRRNEVLMAWCNRFQSDETMGAQERRTALWRCLWDLAPHRSGGSPNAAPKIRAWPAVIARATLEDETSATNQVVALLLDMIEYFAESDAESEHLVDMFWPLDEGGRFMRLPPEARARALGIVEESATQGALDRSLLGDRLRALIRLHRQFSDAFWTLEPDGLVSVEQVAERIGDDDPATAGAWLFESHAPDIDVTGLGKDREVEERRLAERRRTAVTEAYAAGGLVGVRRLAVRAQGDREVSGVQYIGCVLAELANSGELTLVGGESTLARTLTFDLAGWVADDALPDPTIGALEHGAPQPIGPQDDSVPLDLVALGFLTETLRQLHRQGADLAAWLANLGERHLSTAKVARLLAALREFPLAWDIAEALGPEVEAAYWAHFAPLPYGMDLTVTAQATERLLVSNRADAAIELLWYQRLEAVGPDETAGSDSSRLVELVLRALEAVAASDTPRMAQGLRFRTEEMLDWLNDRLPLTEHNLDDPKQIRLAQLELLLDEVPGSRSRPSVLHARLSLDPRFFVELVASMYARADEGEPDNADEATKADTTQRLAALAAGRPWTILYRWKQVPGTREDGSVDPVSLGDWVREAREKFKELDLSGLGCNHLGQMLAKAPADPDDELGIVPPSPIRDLIEEVRDPDVENGLAIGISNLRGVHSRGLMDGGESERELSRRYRDQAQAIGDRWPRTARVLRLVADSYDSHGRMHDVQSEWFARGT